MSTRLWCTNIIMMRVLSVCPSVRPSVYSSVPYGLLTRKQGAAKLTSVWTVLMTEYSNRYANFQLKRSGLCLALGLGLRRCAAPCGRPLCRHLADIFLRVIIIVIFRQHTLRTAPFIATQLNSSSSWVVAINEALCRLTDSTTADINVTVLLRWTDAVHELNNRLTNNTVITEADKIHGLATWFLHSERTIHNTQSQAPLYLRTPWRYINLVLLLLFFLYPR